MSGRILGIDFGTKRIGLALSDESAAFAFPHSVLPNDKKALAAIGGLCTKEGVQKILVGIPIGFSGQETEMSALARSFGRELEGAGFDVVYVNEVLSTREAERGLTEKRSIDAAAAAIVLQSFLDRKSL